MRFAPLLDPSAVKTPGGAPDAGELRAEYKAGRGVGPVTLGERRLFFRRLLTVWYIPYGSISRFFRRVQAIPAKIGCCAGEVRVENLVVCAPDGDGERELAQIQLPGERAALAVMEELKRRAPDAVSVCPPKAVPDEAPETAREAAS